MLKRFVISLILLASSAFAQTTATTGPGGLYNIGTVSTTGQLGLPVSYQNTPAAPSAHTFDWYNAGTAPTACSFQIEGSSDGTHWYALTASTSCTTANMFHIAYKPVVFIRVNILTYTAGDGTTAVKFDYVRGVS